MSDTDNPLIDRERGILTERDREFLLGEVSYEGQQLTNRRNYVRKRIANAIIDFSIINENLDPKDRDQIFTDLQYEPGPTFGQEIQASAGFLQPGMIDAISFLYKGANSKGIPFDVLLERGIRKGIEDEKRGEFGVLDVDIDVEYVDGDDFDELLSKFKSDEQMSPDEAELFLRYLLHHPDTIDEDLTEEELVKKLLASI